MKDNKPRHFLIFKIVGSIAMVFAVIGIFLTISGFGDFETNSFMIGGFMTTFGFFVGFTCLIIGFSPNISKLSVKTARYIQEENKDDLQEIASTSAEIASDAITTVTKAVKNGFDDKIFCKHCGKPIDADSKFCSHCGKEL